jgi:hypothetical protein
VANAEDGLQRGVYTLNNIAIIYNFNISVIKTKAMAMKRKRNVGIKIAINNNIFEQVNSFNYLGYTGIA